MSDNNSSRITARWILPGDGEPIEDGLIEITDGLITDVTSRRGAPDRSTVDLGNAAIIPGLVNAHAHLEFADLSEPIQPAAPFTDWIQSLLAYRRERTEPLDALIARGQQESADAGVSLVGDIATGEWTPDCIQSTHPTVIAFRELIGLRPDQANDQIEIARRHIEQCRAAGDHVMPAISPHAPYSVSPDLFHRSVDLARQENVPLCMHLAETPAELQLLRDGTGELFEMLNAFGVWQNDIIPRGTRPLDYLQPLAELQHALIAHGNYLAEDEIDFLCKHPNIAVVFCPRTHHFFGHTEHPWPRLRQGGATVCLGTDGRSSNPDYSLWAELQFLDRQTDGRYRPVLLQMATTIGAQALGQGHRTGTLSVEQRADLCIVELGDADLSDPWELLFSPAARVRFQKPTR
jgi:cytosine/adenosine deaminase-related metal-dependent hydrolase